jgi:histidinol-phosphate aminotransferase
MIWDKANPQLRNLSVYEPGKPIEETAREKGAETHEIIKLASNENARGPAQNAVIGMRAAIGFAQLSPDSSGCYLRDATADRLGLRSEDIILGNGF